MLHSHRWRSSSERLVSLLAAMTTTPPPIPARGGENTKPEVSVVVTPGATTASSVSFTVAPQNADKCAYVCLKNVEGIELPDAVSVMAEAAYRDGLEYNRALCADLSRKAEKAASFIKENCPLLSFVPPHASFIAFIDCSAILDKVIEDRNMYPELYEDYYLMSHFFGQRGGVCMNDGAWFGGEDYKAYVRFNFGCGDDLLDKGLEGIKKAYDYITKL